MAKMLPLHSTASRAAIERRAKKIFHAKGQPAGRDLEHWLEAEGEFMLSVALRNGHTDARPTEARPIRFYRLR
jgi:hypothetical protein